MKGFGVGSAMAVIHEQEKWLYLFEPHTASRSTKEMCLAMGRELAGLGSHHVPLDVLLNEKDFTTDLTGYAIISTIRNPIDVLVTRWAKRRQHVTFADWTWRFKGHAWYTEPMRKLYKWCNIVVYYEVLRDDLDYVFQRRVELPYNENHKAPNKEPWYTYMDDKKVRDICLNCCADIMKTFGYEYGTINGQPTMWIDKATRKTWVRKLEEVQCQ
jgi:hypothetical protein